MTEEPITESVDLTAILEEAKKRGSIESYGATILDIAADPNPYDPPVP